MQLEPLNREGVFFLPSLAGSVVPLILTLLIAATGLAISEALGLQWADVEYDRKRIVVRRSRVEEIGNCKNSHRKAPVALHPVLRDYLRHWHGETMYAKPTDWVFASTKLKGAKPSCGSIASQTYLYPAAVKAGVFEAVEERNRRANWFVIVTSMPVECPLDVGASIA